MSKDVLRYWALSLPLLLSSVFTVMGQQQKLDSLVRKFDRHRKIALHEKLYVHTDRDFYITGETLWLKIYNVEGTLHHSLDLSKVAYVEILDHNNVSIVQAKIALTNGMGSGSLFLPASITTATYKLRAYTQWMKNFSAEFYFNKTITIVNPFIKPEPGKETFTTGLHVDFFPEGGNLVEGLVSKVAYKISDASGKGLNLPGSVVSTAGDTVARFNTSNFGMGHFNYTPKGSVHYKVVVHQPDGSVSMHELPQAAKSGFVMTLKDSSEQYVRVEVRGSVSEEIQEPYIYLFTHSRQIITHAEAKLFLGKPIAFTIDKGKLGEGISHITLFNGQLKPVSERLFFKYPSNNLHVKIQTDQKQFGIRRKVKTSIVTSDNTKQVSANLSVSIYRADSLSSFEEKNIFHFLSLTSDLHGHVESPEFYFRKGAKSAGAIDHLMLTNGWRRFKWTDVLDNKAPAQFVPEYRGHLIQGKVVDFAGKPVKGVITYLSSPGKIIRLYPSVSNEKGEIKFEAINFWGPRQVITQTPTDTTYKIEIKSPFSTEQSTYSLFPLALSSWMEKPLLSRSVAMQVQDIYNETSRERYIMPKVDSTAFFGKADETYYLDTYTRFPVMEEVMREYVSGVMVRKRKDGFHFIVLDLVYKTAMQHEPLILFDGVPVFDIDDIMSFDPRKVRKLEVVTRPYHLGTARFSGIVSYTTYGGDLDGFRLNPNAVKLDYEGLQLQREFFAPPYETQSHRNIRIPDQRSLLYWNPNVTTGTNGNIQFDFFTSDLEGNYLIVVEGLTSEGISGSGSSTFSVKRFDN